jgi:hypothetical protein
MNVHEWHRNGLQPSFATIEQWIDEQLGYLGAEDEAIYAVGIRDEADKAGLAVRVLVCADKGFFDMLWERPDDVAARHLTSRHYLWSDVRGFHLTAVTNLDRETLMHGQPSWRLQIEQPAVDLVCEEGDAALEFWKACMKHLDRAG